MARISRARIQAYLNQGLAAPTRTEQGRALEDLACYVFRAVPGIEVYSRNSLNAFDTEEIDVAFWNDKLQTGLYFLPDVLLVECKNWSRPVGSQEVAYFAMRLQNRGRDHGILIAANGVSGSSEDVNRAHYEIAMALSHRLNILVVTGAELANLRTTDQLIRLLKQKLCELAVSGTVFL